MTDEAQAQVMAWLARMIGARVIVEAGTYHGAATRILAEVNPAAVVWTADPYTSPTFVGNVIFQRRDFLEMLADISEPIDFAYIDATPPDEHGTKHTYRYRLKCGLAVAERLSPHGIICFDDTNPAPWREPFPELGEIQEFCQINLNALKGLSIYQRTETETGDG